MLKKDKKNEKGQPSDAGKFFELKNFSRDSIPKTSNKSTTIGENILIEGKILGRGNLVVEGSVKGDIALEENNFTLGPKGKVEGEIHAQNVRISGQMIGNIKTPGKAEITEEADFLGKIYARSISVENGAYFKGSVKLNREPHSEILKAENSTKVSNPQFKADNEPPPAREVGKTT